MPDRSATGRSLVSRRAIEEIVRIAVLGSYGVVGFADESRLGRVLSGLGLGRSGIRVRTHGSFTVDLRLTIAYGLPVAEVIRQVESVVRYALRRALDREPDRLTIHVGGLRYEPSSVPPEPEDPPGGPASADLADAGSRAEAALDREPPREASAG